MVTRNVKSAGTPNGYFRRDLIAIKEKLTIYEIKERIEKTFSDLNVVWNSKNHKPMIVCKSLNKVVAYAYYKKWIITPVISEYAFHVAAIISLLEKWDGDIGLNPDIFD